MAGRIVKHAGEVVLKLMIDLKKLELFRGVRKKSFESGADVRMGENRDGYSGKRKVEGAVAQKLGNGRGLLEAFFINTDKETI